MILPTKFEEVWISFGLSIIKFFLERELKNRVSALGLYFYLTPVKPTLGLEIVGSTGELVFQLLGFSFWTIAQTNRIFIASV